MKPEVQNTQAKSELHGNAPDLTYRPIQQVGGIFGEYIIPVFLTLIVHAVVLGVMVWHWGNLEPHKPIPPKSINASLIKMKSQSTAQPAVAKKLQQQEREKKEREKQEALKREQQKKEQEQALKLKEEQKLAKIKQAEIEKKKAVEEAEKKAELEKQRLAEIQLAEKKKTEEAEAEKKRLAEQEKKKKAEEEAKKKAEAEKKRLAEQEKKKKAEALAKKKKAEAEAEKKRKAKEQEQQLADLAAEEQELLQESIDSEAVSSFEQVIYGQVTRVWNYPTSSDPNLKVKIRINLLPTGEVDGVNIIKSSGDSAFDRSAEQAVLKASPLSVPEDPRLFEKSFRTITFNFTHPGGNS